MGSTVTDDGAEIGRGVAAVEAVSPLVNETKTL
jgi:hypothetical protein